MATPFAHQYGRFPVAEALFNLYESSLYCPTCPPATPDHPPYGFARDQAGKKTIAGEKQRYWSCRRSNLRRNISPEYPLCRRRNCTALIDLVRRVIGDRRFQSHLDQLRDRAVISDAEYTAILHPSQPRLPHQTPTSRSPIGLHTPTSPRLTTPDLRTIIRPATDVGSTTTSPAIDTPCQRFPPKTPPPTNPLLSNPQTEESNHQHVLLVDQDRVVELLDQLKRQADGAAELQHQLRQQVQATADLRDQLRLHQEQQDQATAALRDQLRAYAEATAHHVETLTHHVEPLTALPRLLQHLDSTPSRRRLLPSDDDDDDPSPPPIKRARSATVLVPATQLHLALDPIPSSPTA